MAIHDVSVPIHPQMVVWPGDPEPVVRLLSSRGQNAAATVRQISLSTHAGTHVDAPEHFVTGGRTVDQIQLERMVGECQVVEVRSEEAAISPRDLQSAWPGDYSGPSRVLLKTLNSRRRLLEDGMFHRDFQALSGDAARWLVDHGVITVGIDYYSIEPFRTPGHPAHMALLSHDVLVIEGVNLADILPGRYRLLCLPIRIAGSDGAPTRVMLEDAP